MDMSANRTFEAPLYDSYYLELSEGSFLLSMLASCGREYGKVVRRGDVLVSDEVWRNFYSLMLENAKFEKVGKNLILTTVVEGNDENYVAFSLCLKPLTADELLLCDRIRHLQWLKNNQAS
jgi:hypothetical protein